MKIDGAMRVGGRTESFTPAANELQHEIPLRAARILEFVDEDVTMTRFEPEPALREFVELLQQADRPLEDSGEIEQRVRFEGLLVLALGDGVNAPDAARHHDVQIAPESANGICDSRRDRCRRLSVSLPRVVGRTISGAEGRSGEILAARIAVLFEEVRSQTVDQTAKGGLIVSVCAGGSTPGSHP